MKKGNIIKPHESAFAQAIKALTKNTMKAQVGLAIYGEVSSEYIENKNKIVDIGFSPENRKLYEAEMNRIAKTPNPFKK